LKLIYELTVGKGLENESVVVDVTSKIWLQFIVSVCKRE
jgi:hypothetical protein